MMTHSYKWTYNNTDIPCIKLKLSLQESLCFRESIYADFKQVEPILQESWLPQNGYHARLYEGKGVKLLQPLRERQIAVYNKEPVTSKRFYIQVDLYVF